MSNVGLSMGGGASTSGGDAPGGGRKRKKRSWLAILITLIVIVAVAGGLAFAGMWALDKLEEAAPAPDYPGPGSVEVVVEVSQGQNLGEIGNTLFASDVVASTEAFSTAATANPEATSITPGSYVMLQQMSAEGAVERLLDPAARNEFVVLIQEGWRTDQTVDQLSEITGIKKSAFNSVIKSPTDLPLPTWAKGTGESRAEGFLFPATYTFNKDMDAKQILNEIVDRFNTMATETDFVEQAKNTKYTPYEVLIIASLIQAEGTGDDYTDISSAIYNRLDPETWGGTYGLLGVDATINYIFKQAESNFTDTEKDSNSPYNTYKFAGLPPTPINSPGEAAIKAAISPEDSNWLYWVHGPDGTTCLATNFDDHEANIAGKCKWE